jgi:hypothetical protein
MSITRRTSLLCGLVLAAAISSTAALAQNRTFTFA